MSGFIGFPEDGPRLPKSLREEGEADLEELVPKRGLIRAKESKRFASKLGTFRTLLLKFIPDLHQSRKDDH
jgi:hypothetical protein